MKIKLHDDNKITVDCSDAVFAEAPNDHVVHKAIVVYNKKRESKAANKGRSDIAFSKKKPWQQKGLGKARAGARSSPIWRKGGVTFAKEAIDRTNSFKINRKEYRKAIKVMLSDHFRNNAVKVVSKIDVESTKTKSFKSAMSKFEFTKDKQPKNWTGLIITDLITEEIYLGSANLYEYMITDVYGIDPLSLKHASELLITKSALEKMEEWLS